MRIYIVGSVASGKSTLARCISEKTGVPCFHLDEIAHAPDPNGEDGNKKRPEAERDAMFGEIISGDYIVEDTGRACFIEGMRNAEKIVMLDLPYGLRCRRIITRYIRQKLGAEKSSYTPSLSMTRRMFGWAKAFDTGADGTKGRVAEFGDRVITLRSVKEIKQFLEEIK